jgi:hypothetical protein
VSLNTEDYANLANDAYNDPTHAVLHGRDVSIHGHSYKVIYFARNAVNGFHATAYQRTDTGEVIIAYRGTDLSHALTGTQDIVADAAMVVGKVNPQMADAEKFTRHVLEYAREHGIPTDQITVTGHSLGGTLAEIESCRFNLGGQTFNAYGAAGLGYGIPAGGSRIIDNVLDGDVVSAASPHYGQVRHFATQEDIDGLREGGYLGGVLASPLVAAVWGDHSISHFAPPAGQPSVLTATNEARAQEYAEAIARYRHDVYAATRHVHDAAQINPWERMKGRLEVDVLLAEAGVVSAERAGERAAHGLEQEVAHGIQAMEHAAEQAGEVIDREAATVKQNGSSLLEGVEGVEREIGHLRPPLLLTDPRHTEHALFESARSAVRVMERRQGIRATEESGRLAAALTVAATREGMQRIDRVELTDHSRRAFAFEEHPYAALKCVAVDVRQAINTSMAQHSEQAQADHRARQAQQLQAPPWQPEHIQASPPPVHHGFSR